MAKESKEPTRKGAEPETPVTKKFGNYAVEFMEEKLTELMNGKLVGTGINKQEFANAVIGYGLLKQKNALDEITRELGL